MNKSEALREFRETGLPSEYFWSFCVDYALCGWIDINQAIWWKI